MARGRALAAPMLGQPVILPRPQLSINKTGWPQLAPSKCQLPPLHSHPSKIQLSSSLSKTSPWPLATLVPCACHHYGTWLCLPVHVSLSHWSGSYLRAGAPCSRGFLSKYLHSRWINHGFVISTDSWRDQHSLIPTLAPCPCLTSLAHVHLFRQAPAGTAQLSRGNDFPVWSRCRQGAPTATTGRRILLPAGLNSWLPHPPQRCSSQQQSRWKPAWFS